MFGKWKTATIVSGQTTSAEVDLGDEFSSLLVILPDMTNATATILVSDVSGGTFTTLDKPDGAGSMTLPKQKAHVVKLGGVQFVKVVGGTEVPGRSILLRGCN